MRRYFQQYEEWKKNLPDTEWMKSLIPDVEVAITLDFFSSFTGVGKNKLERL